jgi:hypothetical protein
MPARVAPVDVVEIHPQTVVAVRRHVTKARTFSARRREIRLTAGGACRFWRSSLRLRLSASRWLGPVRSGGAEDLERWRGRSRVSFKTSATSLCARKARQDRISAGTTSSAAVPRPSVRRTVPTAASGGMPIARKRLHAPRGMPNRSRRRCASESGRPLTPGKRTLSVLGGRCSGTPLIASAGTAEANCLCPRRLPKQLASWPLRRPGPEWRTGTPRRASRLTRRSRCLAAGRVRGRRRA